MKRRMLSLLLACSMLSALCTLPTAAADGSLANFTRQNSYREGQYSDVKAGDWCAENIRAGTEFGIFKGYGSRFGVKDSITRLQCIIVACRLHSIYHTGADRIEQSDTGTKQAIYTAYAAAHGIKHDFARVDIPATRAEFAAVLASALPDAALAEINALEYGSLPDVDGTETYAMAVYRLYRAGVLNGSNASRSFLPEKTINRAQACAIATRMVDPSLRKTLTAAKDTPEEKMQEPLFQQQWALTDSDSFRLEEKKNEYSVYEPDLGKFCEPYQWENPLKSGKNAGTVMGAPNADIGIEQAWALYNGGVRETVIALIDTGVDINHEDLKDSIWVNKGEIPDNGIDDDHNGYIDDVHGWDFCNDSNVLYRGSGEDSHGTHNAGIIAANAINGIGIAGIAYSSKVKIMVLKVFGESGNSKGQSSLAEAIRYAEKNGAVICNMSLAGPLPDRAVRDALENSEMLFVASAGNSGNNSDKLPVYPACYDFDNLISVANLSCDGRLYTHSNYGSKSVDIAAPGSYILSTQPGNNYAYMTGTSMAAPVVAAAAAMLYSQYSNITTAQIKDILLKTVKPIPSLAGKCVTGGTLDLGAAMQYAAEMKGLL